MKAELINGRFEVGPLEARGGMATVHRGVDRASGATVAIKRLSGTVADAHERFDREINVLRAIEHPRVVRCLDHGTTPSGHRYLVMEWLEGETLRDRLAGVGLSALDAVTALSGVLDALYAIHTAGVVHRDVKPSNLMFRGDDPSGIVLLDFGIAHVGEDTVILTNPGEVIGTWAYMSPEQAAGRRRLDGRADLFSLGCIAYEALTGLRPFRGRGSTAVLSKILVEDPVPPSELRRGIDRPLERFVLRLLEKDPDARFDDAAAALRELTRIDVSPELGPPPRGQAAKLSVGGLLPNSEAQETAAAPNRQPKPKISSVEQRLVCLGAFVPPRSSDGPTREALNALATRRRVRLSWMADGSAVAAVSSPAATWDDNIHLVDTLLALGVEVPGARGALGWGPMTFSIPPQPAGTVRDRLDTLLTAAAPGEIRVDRDTVSVLGHLLAWDEDPRGYRLLGMKAAATSTEDVFIGRRAEIRALEALMEDAIEEDRLQLAIVEAPTGMGKTALARELIRRAAKATPPIAVRYAAARARGAGAFEFVRQLLRASEPSAQRDRALERIEHLAGRLPSHAAVKLGDDVRAAWADWARVPPSGPLLILLDDLDAVDSASVELIRRAVERAGPGAVLVVGLSGPGLDPVALGWESRHPLRLNLRPLSEAQSRALVDQIGPDLDEADREGAVARAQGVPLYLSQLVEAARHSHVGELPDGLLAVIQSRLATCARLERRVLRTASVFGDPFPREGVNALVGQGDLSVVFTALERKGFLRPRDSDEDPDWASFHHGLLPEAFHRTLTPDDRVIAHGMAAAWLKGRPGADPDRLAAHWLEAGDTDRAARALERAAERALAAQDTRSAIEWAERAIELIPAPSDRRSGLLRIQAEAHRWRGNVIAAMQRAIAAAEEATPGSAGWFKAHALWSMCASSSSRLEYGQAIARRVAAATASEGAELAALVCRGQVAMDLLRTGQPPTIPLEPTLAALRERIERGPPVDAWTRGWFHQVVSGRWLLEGRTYDAVESLREAHRAYHDGGFLRAHAGCGVDLGYGLATLGRLEEASAVLDDAVRAGELLDVGFVTQVANAHRALVSMRLGELDAARRQAQRAREQAAERELTRIAARATIYLAMVALAAGDPDRARLLAREALDQLEARSNLIPDALAVAARAHVTLGDVLAALEQARTARELADDLPTLTGHALVDLALVEAYAAANQPEAAREAVTGALERLERGIDGAPAELRRSYYGRVPEHLALREWGRRLEALGGGDAPIEPG